MVKDFLVSVVALQIYPAPGTTSIVVWFGFMWGVGDLERYLYREVVFKVSHPLSSVLAPSFAEGGLAEDATEGIN